MPSVCTVLPLSDLHPVTKCLGEDLFHKLLPIVLCQTVTTVYFIVFSYHYSYAMIILKRTAAVPESNFRLSHKPSMERATVAYSKDIYTQTTEKLCKTATVNEASTVARRKAVF